MSQELLNIVLSALGVVVTGLASWAVSALVSWINTKIKDKKLASFLVKITAIITDAVKSIYQQFVEALKKEGKFDEAAQKEAKEKALEIINSQLTVELKDYITENFGDITAWLSEKIESVIYSLKNGSTILVAEGEK